MGEFSPQVIQSPDHAAIGREMLKSRGLDPMDIGSIQLFAGGQCQGTLDEFMGMEEHAHVRDEVFRTVDEALASGVDPKDAVVNALGLFVRRDENGEVLKAVPAQAKKNDIASETKAVETKPPLEKADKTSETIRKITEPVVKSLETISAAKTVQPEPQIITDNTEPASQRALNELARQQIDTVVDDSSGGKDIKEEKVTEPVTNVDTMKDIGSTLKIDEIQAQASATTDSEVATLVTESAKDVAEQEKLHPAGLVTESHLTSPLATETDVLVETENEDGMVIAYDEPTAEIDYVPNDERAQLMVDDILDNATGDFSELPEPQEFAEHPNAEIDAFWLDEDQDEFISSDAQISYVKEQLAEYLEPLSADEAESVTSLVATIIQTACQFRELHETENVDKLPVEQELQELKELCMQLFEYIGVDYNEDTLELFLQNVLQVDTVKPNSDNIEHLPSFMQKGTHEQRQSTFHILNVLAQLIKQKTPSFYFLGRLALQFGPVLSTGSSIVR